MIKVPSPTISPKRVFLLSTPRHLFTKLHWEISQLKEIVEGQNDNRFTHLTASYAAFNIAVTAWHLSDWTWASMSDTQKSEVAKTMSLSSVGLRKFQEKIREQNPFLEICWDIANGSKHWEDRNGSDVEALLIWDITEATANTLQAGDPLVKYRYRLQIFHNQNKLDAMETFESVKKFWKKNLSQWGFLEDEIL